MKSNGKVRPLGLRGRTPYKVMQGSVCILAFFHVLRALATTEKIAASSNCLVMCVHGTPHAVSCLRSALRLWLFLGCNRISGQTQNDIAFPCTAILRLACHRV